MSGIKNKILILFAHPSPARSEVNFPLLQASQQLEGITVVDLYHEYPTFRINIDREQQRLRDHNVIIFMFPLYWYSTPSILKEWQDLVLEYGFAYGSEGTALHGKAFFCALTAGGPESAYCAEGYNHYTLKELLQPLEQTAILTGMEFWAPFALFNARMAQEEQRVAPHVADWLRLLRAIKTDRIDREAACRMPILNKDLDAVIREAQ